VTGTKNSGNPYRCDILWTKPIGEVVLSIISGLDYGKGTFAGKCVLEVLKDEIIKRKGQEFFDYHYAFWSMNNAQQKAKTAQKEKEKHDRLVAQYLGLGQTPQEAENLASSFPDGNPLEVVKIRTYANQNKQKLDPKPKFYTGATREQLLDLKQGIEANIKILETKLTDPQYNPKGVQMNIDKEKENLVHIDSDLEPEQA
jgi:hypothetical protein